MAKHIPLKQWTKVQVTWIDAYTTTETNVEAYMTYHPCIRIELGYVIVDAPDRLVIAGTDDRDSVGSEVDRTVVLPRAYIKDVQELVFKNPSKRK